MSSPRIVVGMGVFNEQQYLDETIPAVLAQTMPDFGFLLFNNGSTDDTTQILRDYRDKDPRIVLVELPTNVCPGDAANLGWNFALGYWRDCPWFVGAGADDVMAPDYLEAILDAAKSRRDTNCIFSPWQWIDHPEKGVFTFPPYHPPTVATRLQIPGWRAFTREIWRAVGGEDRDIYIGADWDWATRASVMGVLKPHQLDRPYISLRVREDRKSQSDLVDWPKLREHMMRHRRGRFAQWS